MIEHQADEWRVRLAAALAIHKRRAALKALARGDLAAARKVGLALRHATRLRRSTEGNRS